MGRTEKLLDKLAQSKSTFNWNELDRRVGFSPPFFIHLAITKVG